jgi:hypothetical protein
LADEGPRYGTGIAESSGTEKSLDPQDVPPARALNQPAIAAEKSASSDADDPAAAR